MGWDCNSEVKHLPSLFEAWVPFPVFKKKKKKKGIYLCNTGNIKKYF